MGGGEQRRSYEDPYSHVKEFREVFPDEGLSETLRADGSDEITATRRESRPDDN